MGKFLFWLVVVFAVLLGVRLYASAKQRAARGPAARRDSRSDAPMVRCERCGVFLPTSDASRTATGYRCTDARCAPAG